MQSTGRAALGSVSTWEKVSEKGRARVGMRMMAKISRSFVKRYETGMDEAFRQSRKDVQMLATMSQELVLSYKLSSWRQSPCSKAIIWMRMSKRCCGQLSSVAPSRSLGSAAVTGTHHAPFIFPRIRPAAMLCSTWQGHHQSGLGLL
eukprot:6208850-Pleurochrysis_carterae.AAC.2